jgi:hypothetical protein
MAAVEEGTTRSNRFIRYDPATTTFREFDKKMLVLRPDLEYWTTVLTEDHYWDRKDGTDENATLISTPEEILKLKKADRIAHSCYVLGSCKSTEPYTNGRTAYEIREALRKRFSVFPIRYLRPTNGFEVLQ